MISSLDQFEAVHFLQTDHLFMGLPLGPIYILENTLCRRSLSIF